MLNLLTAILACEADAGAGLARVRYLRKARFVAALSQQVDHILARKGIIPRSVIMFC